MVVGSKRLISRFQCWRTRRVLGGLLLAGWTAGVALGFVVLMDYQNAPGRPAEPPARWPSSSALSANTGGRGTLILFAHPRCPCTRATLGELERLLRHVHNQIVVYAVFVQPEARDREWARDHLWYRASAMPQVQVVRDLGGKEARRFGAFTSGQVLYYDARQRLQFAGGITGSRGHEGNNKGRQALTELIQSGSAERSSTFVFGCALQPATLNAWKQFRLGRSSNPRSPHHAHGAHGTMRSQ